MPPIVTFVYEGDHIVITKRGQILHRDGAPVKPDEAIWVSPKDLAAIKALPVVLSFTGNVRQSKQDELC